MHWTTHSSLGVATIVFYAPALIASIALLHLYGPPRMAWFFLTLMCCIRIASATLVILYESGGQYHEDLSTSTSILLSVGIFPLLFAFIGWFYILERIDQYQPQAWLRWYAIGLRVAGATAMAILIAGSILRGPLDDTANGVRVGAGLAKAGAVLVTAILGCCIGIMVALWVDVVRRQLRSKLLLLILAMLSLSAMLLVLRVAYMCLAIFKAERDGIWSPLDGSLDPLVRLSLLPEYVVVVVMLGTGLWMRKCEKVSKVSVDDIEID